jgi:hypothetical protein
VIASQWRARRSHSDDYPSKLLAEKQKLIERLEEEVDPEERDEIKRLLENINVALDSLEMAGPLTRNVD